MSLLVVCEILGIFVKTLIADHNYPPSIVIIIKSLFDVDHIVIHNEKFT